MTFNRKTFPTYAKQGFPTLIHRVTRWPGQDSQASAGLVPTALMYLDGQVKAVGYEALTPEAQEMADDDGWSLTKGFPLRLFLPASGHQSLALDPLPTAVSLSTVYSDYMKYLLERTRSYFWDHIIDGEAIWIKQWQLNNVTIVFKVPNSCSTKEQEFLRQAFRGVPPSITMEGSRPRLKTLAEGEAIIYEAMLYNSNRSSKLSHGANMIVCHTEESWTNLSTYRLVQKSSNLPYFSLINDTRLAAGYLFVKRGLEAYLSQLLAESNISQNDREEYIQSGLKDFGEQAMLAFCSPETDHSICIAGSRFNNLQLRVRRGQMSIPGFFDPSVLEIIREIENQISKCNSETKMLISVGELGENPYFRASIGQKLDGCGCHIVDNGRRSRLGVEGALYCAAFDGDTCLKPLDITARIGALVGERYDESNPDHQGRKVHRGHGGFNIIGNRWSEIVKLSDLTHERPSIRRRIVRSLNPSRKATPGMDRLRYNIWVFENGLEEETVSPVWVKDIAGQTNPGFRMLCQVEANLEDWKGTLVRKYAKTKPKDALEMFLVVRLDGTSFYASLEWMEGELARSGPPVLLG